MPVYLKEAEVRELLDWPAAIEAVETAHRLHGQGLAGDTPRARTRTPTSTLHILQGAIPSLGLIGYKAYTSSRSGTHFLLHLFDVETGEPRAVIEADWLGVMRTGAAGAVAAKYLARSDAKAVGVFGAGHQAEGQVRALAASRVIKTIKVCARNPERLADFCARMEKATGVEVIPTPDARKTVEGSDIVVTITTSREPLFEGAWLAPGTHVTAAGSNALTRREIDTKTVTRSALVCVDARATALNEAGDLLPALESGRLAPEQLIELGQVVAGHHPGRASAADITLFESQGMAIQDIALGARVLRLAGR